MGGDSEISGIAYNGSLVRHSSPGTISSQDSWIFVLACSYLVGYGPIFTIRLMWAQRLIVPGMGRVEWDYPQQQLCTKENIGVELPSLPNVRNNQQLDTTLN
jgi:hypothetical protein